MRTVILGLIALGLAFAVFVMWPRGSDDEPAGTAAAATTLTTAVAAPSTTTPNEPTTAAPDSHVVETVEEAEEILRELWFGWFEGIYDQDEDRIREVVGNPNQIEAARAQFGVMEFTVRPAAELITLSSTEILRADEQCFAVWSEVSGSFRGGSISGVHVFRSVEDSWLLINTWPLREDLWESDCDVVLS